MNHNISEIWPKALILGILNKLFEYAETGFEPNLVFVWLDLLQSLYNDSQNKTPFHVTKGSKKSYFDISPAKM